MKQPDLFGAIEARDEGMQRVLENTGAWKHQAKVAFRRIVSSKPLTGEDIRHAITHAIGPPHDPHAWGPLINWGIEQGVIRKHGRAQMRDRRSHARETPTYVILPWDHDTDAETN